MALSALTYYSNSITGNPTLVADVDLYSVQTTAPKFPVGYGFKRADGNVYRYCQLAATAVNAGQLVGQTTASGGATYGAAVIVPPASAVVVPGEPNITAGSAGSHFVEVTIAAIALNKYAGGYLCVTRGTGLGETYRIKGNTATNTPATGNLRIQLYEPIKVALQAGQGIIIVPSMYTDLVVTPTSASTVTGVLMSTTTSAISWAWVCTHGVVGCQEDATTAAVAGMQVVASRVTAGAYAPIAMSTGTGVFTAAFAQPVVGYVITQSGGSSASNRNGAIYVTIEG